MAIEKHISVQDKSIFYISQGKGPCLVLLHGFTEALDIWKDFARQLSQDFQVICTDLPGHGKTSSFSNTHTMDFMADIVKVVLDDLNINQCIMIGHSMGGYTALAYARKYPETIRAIGLFHSQAAADSNEAKANRIRTINEVETNHTGFIQGFIPELFNAKHVSLYQDEIEELQKLALLPPPEGIAAALRGMMERSDHTVFLSTFNKPVLFIAGKADSRIPLDLIFDQASLLDHAEVVILGKAGHMGFIEARKESLQAIKAFALKVFDLL